MGLPTAIVQIQLGSLRRVFTALKKTKTILRQNNVSELSASRVLIMFLNIFEHK